MARVFRHIAENLLPSPSSFDAHTALGTHPSSIDCKSITHRLKMVPAMAIALTSFVDIQKGWILVGVIVGTMDWARPPIQKKYAIRDPNIKLFIAT